MRYTAAVITVSDKGSRGERVDTSGPAVRAIVEADDRSCVVDNGSIEALQLGLNRVDRLYLRHLESDLLFRTISEGQRGR